MNGQKEDQRAASSRCGNKREQKKQTLANVSKKSQDNDKDKYNDNDKYKDDEREYIYIFPQGGYSLSSSPIGGREKKAPPQGGSGDAPDVIHFLFYLLTAYI